jgi:YDG domain
MSMHSRIRNLLAHPVTRPIRKAFRFRPALEVLEDRYVPSTIVVNNPTDTPVINTIDLRQAIALANLNGGPEAITFDSTVFATPQTIALTAGQLELSDQTGPETITGPAAPVTIDAGGLSRVLQVDGGVTASLTGLTLSGGNTTGNGGGVDNAGTLALMNCTLSGNSSSGVVGGGGLYNSGPATLTDCTVSGNSAAIGDGGGMYNSVAGPATLTDCTVSGNSAVSGGGIANQGTLSIGNTIVALNTASTSGPDALGTFASLGFNLIGQTDGSTGWVGSDLTGTTAHPLNPRLAPLDSYGGPTQTMALLPGSPALDAGDPSDTSADQRGVPVQNGPRDIGAFESHGFTVAIASGNFQQTAPDGALASPLKVTVTANDPSEPVAGGQVIFAAPTSGASAWLTAAWLTAAPVSIDGNGNASVTATANYTAGSYSVTASAGSTYATSFSLSNKFSPGFSGLLSPSIEYGTATTTMIGHLSSPLGSGEYDPPANEPVSITINGVTKTVALNGSGNFSVAFTTGTLGVAGSPYTVTYFYPGDPICAAASNNSSTLTVTPAPLTAVVMVDNKVYNGTTAATIASEALSGTVFNSDGVSLTGGIATFDTPTAGNGKTVTVTGLSLTGVSAANYALISTTVTTTADIIPATPTITWNNPAAIAYLTALGSTQLDATASVPGNFVYSPPAGTLLPAGTQTLSVTFTPTDSTDYTTATATATLLVLGPGVTPVGTVLYVVGGSTSNDNVEIDPAGSTGVKVEATLDRVHSTTTLGQAFTAIVFVGGSGNDNIQLAGSLTIPTSISAGDGNDNVQLGNSTSTVTLGNGNDHVQAGDGTNTVTLGNGNDNVLLGNGSNSVTLGGGNDHVQLGNGNNDSVWITGSGNDNVQLGNGNNDSVWITGNGNDNVQLGNGNNDSVWIIGNGNESVTTGDGSGSATILGTGHRNLHLGGNWTHN